MVLVIFVNISFELGFLLQNVAIVLLEFYCVRNMLHAAMALQVFLPQLFDHVLIETLFSQCLTVIKQCFSLPRQGSCQLSVLTHESMSYRLVSLSLENKRVYYITKYFDSWLLGVSRDYNAKMLLKCKPSKQKYFILQILIIFFKR